MSRDDEDEPDDRPRRPRRRRDDDPDDEYDRARSRRRDDDDVGPGRLRRRPVADAGTNGLATAGLVLGILSLVTACFTGIPAVVCSAIALGRPEKRGAATAGLVLGVLGTLLTLPVMIGLLLPAVQKVSEAAARTREMSNLKELSLGYHNYEAANQNFPPALGPVSWRVHVLPFVQQNGLYQKFDVTQPWDGPRNRPLASTRVVTFASPLDPPDSADTRYRVFTGPATMYEPGQPPPSVRRIEDGLSNTIFAVDAAEAVPWPQPKELEVTRDGLLPAVGHPNRDVVLVAMADGSVRPVKKAKLSDPVLRAMISPRGGEAPFTDW